jgi:hypothetical protein
MRHQKIRGHNRRYRQIENWRLENIDLRTDLIEEYNGDHIDIVHYSSADYGQIKSFSTITINFLKTSDNCRRPMIFHHIRRSPIHA